MKIVEKDIKKINSPSQFADLLGMQYTATVTKEHKKEEGQFFTPNEIASFMGKIASKPLSKKISILDPGCGTAILSCSLIEKLIKYDIEVIELIVYETDKNLLTYTEQSLQNLKNWLTEKGIKFNYKLLNNDFIEDMAISSDIYKESFDYIISNPPYFKLSKDDSRVNLLQHLVKGQSNIYSFFMAVSVNLLKSSGELIFIVPRSFASGHYFNSFRDYFFKYIHLNFIHLFKSRSKTFDRDNVLQETLILKGSKAICDRVLISNSEGISDLDYSLECYYDTKDIIDLASEAKILHLPTTKLEEKVILLFKSWKNKLIDFNIQISTGPVVSFRSKDVLFDTYQNSTIFLAPLYWLHNVTKMNIDWPIFIANKSQYINVTETSKKILLPNKNYVFLRRFSSKDDNSRLVAAPYFKENNQADVIGVENKLNYIYRLDGELQQNEAVGISALLNSEIFDIYFRTFNGNINVSATEIRLMPFPPIEDVRVLGEHLITNNDYSQDTINKMVIEWIKQNTELDMNKIEEAQIILRDLGLPKSQQNEISALTLLALCDISESDDWKDVKKLSLGVSKGIMKFISDKYQKEYAPNTRETVRRQVLHQFVQGRIADYNPDIPDLPVNSPRAHYALSDEAAAVIRSFGTQEWDVNAKEFRDSVENLAEKYAKIREVQRVPVTLPNGKIFHLSPGKHNEVQAAIIEQFRPQFAKDSELLYLGDTELKDLYSDAKALQEIGIPIDQHSKLPDVVLFDSEKNWLYLIEAVTSHGPVSPKRVIELEKMLEKSSAGKIYVTAFPDFKEFKKWSSQIAWETEIWICEMPSHMIHFNGDRFIGPR